MKFGENSGILIIFRKNFSGFRQNLKSFFRFFCEDNIIFFVLIITIRCFPTLSKRNFRKKFENKILNWKRISSKTTVSDDHHHDDDDDVDISTGDCGYRKHPINSKIFCNNLHGSKKIVKIFQSKKQPATWPKYVFKNTKNLKKSKFIRKRRIHWNFD